MCWDQIWSCWVLDDQSFDCLSKWFPTTSWSGGTKDHAHCQKVHFLSHKSESPSKISMDPWKVETSWYVCKSKIYLAFWVTDSQIINGLQQFRLGCTKSDVGFKLGGRHVIQNDFVRTPFQWGIKNNTWILSRLDLHSLGYKTTPWREMEYPKLGRKHMTVFFFLGHCLGHNLRIHFECGLIALLNNRGVHFWSLFEAKSLGTTLSRDPFNMSSISLVDMQWNVL